MKLSQYLKSLSPDQRAEFAARCGTSLEYLRQVAYGNRTCRESLAINIERESNAAVTCEESRPDGVDWAYLRNSASRGPADIISSERSSEA